MSSRSIILLAIVTWLCIQIPLSSSSSASFSTARGEGGLHKVADTELGLLLKIAREYRDGNSDVPRNLDRSVHFFQYILEQDKEKSVTSATAGSELYNLLLAYPHLKSKVSRWQLLSLVAEQGDGQAQHSLATALGSGVYMDGIVPMDAAKALLLDYSAALSGNALANMAMGYRFLQGIGVVQSCDRALPHYEYAANLAAEYLQAQVMQPSLERIRPSDFSSMNIRSTAGAGRGHIFSRQEISSELADYYAHLAEAGDVGAANILGTFYLHGSRNFPPNYPNAVYFLNLAAALHHPPAAGMLGYFLAKSYLKENGKENNGNYTYAQQYPTVKIVELLRLAEKKGDAYGIMGTAYIHEHGIGVDRNLTRALELYNKCLHIHGDAGFFAGELRLRHMQQAKAAVVPANTSPNPRNYDIAAAVHAYTAASALGNVQATHRLGHLAARGMGMARSCDSAVHAFKTVAERGPWMKAMNTAYATYRQQETGGAHAVSSTSTSAVTGKTVQSVVLQTLWQLLPLAVAGVENAQFLAAYLLSQHAQDLPVLPYENSVYGVFKTPNSEIEEKLLAYNISLTATFSADQWTKNLDMLQTLKQSRQQQSTISSTSNGIGNGKSESSSQITGAVKNVLMHSEQWRRWLAAYLHNREVTTGSSTKSAASGLYSGYSSGSSSGMDDEEELLLYAQRLAEVRALSMLGLSASQGNADALVMLGDFHYYGSALLSAASSRAARYYQRAADLHHTQAIFNLGVMHEVGDGVAQDFHLAKRFFDMAAEVDTKARLPRDLALLVMEAHKNVLRYLGEDSWFLSLIDVAVLDALRAFGAELVRWLDFLSNECVDAYQRHSMSWRQISEETIVQTMPAKQRFWLRHVFDVVKAALAETLGNIVKAVEKASSVKVIVFEQEEISMLAGLLLLLVSLLLTKILLRRRERLVLLQNNIQ